MKKIFTLFFALVATAVLWAEDFSVDGIYYNYLGGNNVAVTYKGSNGNSYSGEVTIPASVTYNGTTYSVTSIGDWAFYKCSSLTSLTIPNSVTSIGEYAFYDCSSLTAVTIPNSVTSIGDYAFEYCSKLTSITIPNSVISIGDYAFSNCSKLTSITISNSVTSIGSYAFLNCSSFTSLTIPNSVTNIGEDAFSGCSSLTSMVVEEGNTTYDSRDNCNAIIETATNTLIAGCQNTIIPNGVTSIGNYAFYGRSSLTSITIPNSVTSIGNFAFYSCRSLSSITIPNSVTNIGEGAFGYCPLTSFTIPDGVTHIGASTFSGCTSLTTITIPNSVTSIGNFAFLNCSRLCFITIPNSVTTIAFDAFSTCKFAKDNFINQSSLDAESNNYWGATIVDQDIDGLLIQNDTVIGYRGHKDTIVIPNTVVAVGNNAFQYRSYLTSITIPNSVTSIGNSAFYGCSSLTSITIPNNVKSIGNSAFQGCTALTSIIIPNSVTSIGERAFSGCTFAKDNFINQSSLDAESNNYWGATIVDQDIDGLLIQNDTVIGYRGNKGTIIIPNTVVAIGNNAFFNCFSLTSVTVGNSVTSIGDYAFQGCTALTSIIIPNSVTSIGKQAFDRCSALTSITIPESVTTIGKNAFEYCTNLTSIVWNPVSCTGFWTEETTYSIFYGCENVTSVAFGNKVAEIPRYLCSKKPKLTSITIPESVKTIGEYAFSYCYSLDTIIIPDNVTDVKRGAFYDCSHLKSVTIGNGVKTIGDYAFYDCVALQNAILGNRVTTIGKSVFYNCASLTSITIPNSVTSIGERAFRGCFFIKNNFINNSSLDEVANDYWGAEIADIEQDGLLICNDTVVGCRPMVTSAVIPNTITCIGNNAFQGCSSITSITIPNSVTSIGEWAFDGCYSLISITIPNSVMRIGTLAFQGTGIYNDDSNWENDGLYIDKCFIQARNTISGAYNIKENTRLIGGGAFMECSALTSLIIPYGVIGIGDRAFQKCSSLSSITIPNSVESIGKRAFWNCSSLTSVTIGNSVTSIGEEAFASCSSLNSITIPESVESIGRSAFSNCSLTKTNYTGDVASWCNIKFDTSSANPICYSHNFYINDLEITELVIPNTVDSIHAYVFWGYSSLSSVTIPNSVESIGKQAFWKCSSLTSVTIPKSVTSIGEWAFGYCSALTSIGIEEGNTVYDSRENCNAIIETTSNTLISGCSNTIIPNSVTSIGNSAFYACSSLTSLTIPNSVTSIEKFAFYGCSALDTIHVEASLPPALGSRTFHGAPTSICYIPCGTKTAYEASDWAQYMGEFVEHAVELTSGICGENLYWEYADTKLTISGIGAMYDNIVECLPWAWLLDSIRSIEMSEGITHIAAYAFDGCSALRELHLSASVQSIGEYAFGNTPRLYEITCLAPEPPVADLSSFTNYDAYLHAYCDAQRYYSIDPVWKNFHNVECIVTENEVTGDVTITPSDYEATVVWLSHADAAAYALVITKNDITFCTLKFNKYGQLTNIAFAPSRTHHNKQQAAEATSTGYSFTITGLDENTTYGYAFSVLNEESAVIEEFVGEFTTQSNVSTAVDNVDASNHSTQKLLRDGNLVIIRDGVEYNVMGQQL